MLRKIFEMLLGSSSRSRSSSSSRRYSSSSSRRRYSSRSNHRGHNYYKRSSRRSSRSFSS